MSMFEGLADFKDTPVSSGWNPPLLGFGKVLAFDQSFKATGWASITNTPAGLRVLDAGNFATDETSHKSLEQDFRRARQLSHLVRPVMMDHLHPDSTLAHEMPVTVGKFITNSSRFSALAIWMVADDLGHTPVQVSRISWAKCVAGLDKKATKAQVHKAMSAWASGTPGYEMLTNEARRDAFGIAVKVLADKAPAFK